MKKLVLCYDGTWKTADDDRDDDDASTISNVVRLYRSIRGTDFADVAGGTPEEGAPIETRKWYHRGIGSNWYDRLIGGAFGLGIDRHIREGYKFLVDHYDPGDEIYLFGFSRGAYTVRSLAGLLRTSGLVRREHAEEFDADDNPTIVAAYEHYRRRGGGPDAPEIRRFRAECSQAVVPIKVIGVWDTVGSLGVPAAGKWNTDLVGFHDTRLSSRVEHAFHALAIDEHRPDYPATLWEIEPDDPRDLQQVWFVGAHSDVGGGYADGRLADITLEWMQRRVELGGAGLAIDPAQIPDVRGIDLADVWPADSFAGALHGIYSHFRDRALREILGGELHPTVEAKLRDDPRYRPRNLGYEDDE
ncbi:MAG: DUF2235 domain-containing protein [Nannocystaceae bacterium]